MLDKQFNPKILTIDVRNSPILTVGMLHDSVSVQVTSLLTSHKALYSQLAPGVPSNIWDMQFLSSLMLRNIAFPKISKSRDPEGFIDTM